MILFKCRGIKLLTNALSGEDEENTIYREPGSVGLGEVGASSHLFVRDEVNPEEFSGGVFPFYLKAFDLIIFAINDMVSSCSYRTG